MTLKEEEELNAFIDENLKSGRIHISKSQYMAPCFFISKKTALNDWYRTTERSTSTW
ncbi:hypothetical protein AN958_03270 [Leucoagaricus sp. SymC.cos]|nr:hypothetical protein AN958_03270 [Leucoagaricus sp. SymC.cos]